MGGSRHLLLVRFLHHSVALRTELAKNRGTRDLEWYDPQQIKTENGSLVIKLEQVSDAAGNHNLSYRSGMMSTWNKFCFTGGLIQGEKYPPLHYGDRPILMCPLMFSQCNYSRLGHCPGIVACYLDYGKSWPSGLRGIAGRYVAILVRFVRRRYTPEPDEARRHTRCGCNERR